MPLKINFKLRWAVPWKQFLCWDYFKQMIQSKQKKAVTALTQLWKWNFTYILSLDNNFLKTHSLAWDNFWRLKPLLKWRKMLFISRWKLFSFLRYLHFCPDFLVMQKNSLKRKLWLISQTVTDWIVNIYNIYNITQYLKK